MMIALNLINGKWVEGQAKRYSPSFNPANGKQIGKFVDSDDIDAVIAIEAAKQAFYHSSWPHQPRLRQLVLLDWARRLEEKIEPLAQLLTLENGKVIAQSRGEVLGAISEIRYYAGLARHIPGNFFEVEPGVYTSILKEPAGVAGLIIPWNAPIVLLIRALAPAMAAGCSAVIKSAPQTSQITATVLASLNEVPNLPAGVVNLVSEKGHQVAKTLVESEDVDVISFTGSNNTGQKIMAAAAPTMKKLSLELGGKSCCLVFNDVNTSDIAVKLVTAAIIISGQQCTAARRILVHEACYEEMKVALIDAVKLVNVGFGLDDSSHMGPLIDSNALMHVNLAIERSFDECDEVLVGGGRLGGEFSQGNFISPSLIAHQDDNAFFCQEEIFGPLIILESFTDEKHAVTKANNSEYGLSASVWTNDNNRSLRIARELRNGTIWINDHNKLFAEAETGGYRKSGLGRLHGFDALNDFTEIKSIYQNVGVV
jgi:betaine-aldehyde dehydrogenase